MDNLQFVQRLFNGKNCYSDSMTEEQLSLLHIESGVEAIIRKMVSEGRIVFLTGNPGDGKTFIIKALREVLSDVYVETDLNSIADNELDMVMERIYDCYNNKLPCVIAANEFPFHKLMLLFKKKYPALYEELKGLKKNILVFGYPTVELKRICIVDLNERNLLDKDRCIVKRVIDCFTLLLEPYCGSNALLAHNVTALKNDLVQQQLLEIFTLISLSGQHFVIRDILGALAYSLISCTDPDIDGTGYYYDAFFTGENELMRFARQFDPVLLTSPELDEKLWNGELVEGWQLDCPSSWPADITSGAGSVEDALALFKSIKRKFFFENIYASKLNELQPRDLKECIHLLQTIQQDALRNKRMLIFSMNKLFLSTDEERDKLRVWTSHSYDLSRTPGAAVSTRYIDSDDLELVYPAPVSWLSEMEYSPAYIVLRSKQHHEASLDIDIDMLRGLIMINNGYPAALLSSQYEQVISQFVRALCSVHIDRSYQDGTIMISDRREGTVKKIRIEADKYYLGSEVSY